MRDLIQALRIFAKYTDLDWPVQCMNNAMWICVDPKEVSMNDQDRLYDLGFNVSDLQEKFYSFRFGKSFNPN